MNKKLLGIGILSIVCFIASLLVAATLWNRNLPRGYFVNQTANNQETFDYYVPASASRYRKMPVILALHGGTMDAFQMAELTGLNALAEAFGFIVLYPEQSADRNAQRYWNWFLPENQTRGEGEAALLMDVLKELEDHYPVDKDRRFLLGFSAGGAMALNLQILYPDVFSGIAIAAGMPFSSALNVFEAASAIEGFLPTAEQLALRAIQALPVGTFPLIRATLIHGNEDARVVPEASLQILAQLAAVNDWLDDGIENDSFDSNAEIDSPYLTEGGGTGTYQRYDDSAGTLTLELFLIDSLTHRYPNPNSASSLASNLGMDYSRMAVEFLLELR